MNEEEKDQRIKEQILRIRAKGSNLKGHDSINSFINRNLDIVSKDLVNHVRLYGFDGAIRSQMKTLSKRMTYERVPSNRGGGRY